MKVTGSMHQWFIRNGINTGACAAQARPPQSPIQFPPGSNWVTTVGLSLAAFSWPGLPGPHPHERLGRDV